MPVASPFPTLPTRVVRGLALPSLLALALTAAPRPACAQDIKPFQAEQPKAFHAEQPEVNRPAGGPCTPTEPSRAYSGRARNGAYEGRIDLEWRRAGGSRATGSVSFSDGLVGDGRLDGTFDQGVLRLRGKVDAWPGGTWMFRLEAREAGDGLVGSYAMARSDGSQPQRGEFQVQGGAALDARIVGAWGLVVPGSVANWEFDRGSYVERLQQVSAGAPGGVLIIERDGRYSWNSHGERISGALAYCATANGDSGWALRRGRETFWARYVPGDKGGFYLFSTASGSYTFQGKAVTSNQ